VICCIADVIHELNRQDTRVSYVIGVTSRRQHVAPKSEPGGQRLKLYNGKRLLFLWWCFIEYRNTI